MHVIACDLVSELLVFVGSLVNLGMHFDKRLNDVLVMVELVSFQKTCLVQTSPQILQFR